MAAKSLKHKDNMVWIDMEMTGLDPRKERVIEIATIVTDGELNILAEGPDLVVHQSDTLLSRMDRWNRRQHRKTGLTEAVRRSRVRTPEAERQTLEFLKAWCFPGLAPLCGNSVHHDRKFIARYMPQLDAFLHYRHVDVSTVRTCIERWYPKRRKRPKKGELHRALSDIRESIEELRFYRKHYFK